MLPLGRENVVEQRQPKASLRSQKQGKILGVPIGRADQPEHDLRLHERPPDGVRVIARFQKVKSVPDARAAVALILAGRQNTERLAHIFQGKPQETAVAVKAAIKALNAEDEKIIVTL
jgi:hypothetical protein